MCRCRPYCWIPLPVYWKYSLRTSSLSHNHHIYCREWFYAHIRHIQWSIYCCHDPPPQNSLTSFLQWGPIQSPYSKRKKWHALPVNFQRSEILECCKMTHILWINCPWSHCTASNNPPTFPGAGQQGSSWYCRIKTNSSKKPYFSAASPYCPPSFCAQNIRRTFTEDNQLWHCESPGQQQQFHRLYHSPRRTSASEKMSQLPSQPPDLRKLNHRVKK